MRTLLILFTAFFFGLLSGCATTGSSYWNTRVGTQTVIEKVLATARGLLGQKPEARVTVNGRTFILDCVGTVSAAWWGAGVDLKKDFARYPGDGVNRLYETLKSWGALDWSRTPVPGDLVIWDHTWDIGNDPNYPDGHTHVGLVLSVSSDGTVEYLHESASRGVVLAYMNLYDPGTALTREGRMINSPMFLGSSPGNPANPALWTSGQLWSAFGDGATVVRAAGP